MRFLYTTDLHGDENKFNAILDLAKKEGVKLIHLGGDILPKRSGILKLQKEFIKKFLNKFYAKCQENGIELLGFFGNDDFYTRKKYAREFMTLLDETPRVIDGLTFSAYPFVPDYPFGLKSACKFDYDGFMPEPYISAPVEVDESGIHAIPDVAAYFKAKGTIEEDFKGIHADRNTVIAIHTPPTGLDLDLVPRKALNRTGHTNVPVGSQSVREWVEREQPLLVLSGHIHENYEMTNIWKAMLGETMVIQPGQMADGSKTMAFVDIEINDGKVDSRRHEILLSDFLPPM